MKAWIILLVVVAFLQTGCYDIERTADSITTADEADMVSNFDAGMPLMCMMDNGTEIILSKKQGDDFMSDDDGNQWVHVANGSRMHIESHAFKNVSIPIHMCDPIIDKSE